MHFKKKMKMLGSDSIFIELIIREYHMKSKLLDKSINK